MANQFIGFVIKATDKTKGALVSAKAGMSSLRASVSKLGIGFGSLLKPMSYISGAIRGMASGMLRFTKWGLAGVAGVSAGLIMAMRRAQEFNKQMSLVGTIGDANVPMLKKQVRQLSVELGIAKDELTKGLYDALSAGVPKENAFEFLSVAAKLAVSNGATTAESIDLLTTAVNAFGYKASEVLTVSNILSKAVELGKMTISEMSGALATAAPIAANTGVSLEEVASAAALLTIQGTPVSVAMTQIRAGIMAVNKVMGDGWSRTMTLQQAFESLAVQAGGSAQKLTKLVGGRIEAIQGILGTTGPKAKEAARFLDEVGNSAGATMKAFNIANAAKPMDKLVQGLDNMVRVVGDTALQTLGPAMERAAKGIGEFAEKLAGIQDNPRLKQVRDTIAGITDALFAGGGESKQAFMDIAALLKAGFLDAAGAMMNYLGPKLADAARSFGKLARDGLLGRGKNSAEYESEMNVVTARVRAVGSKQAAADMEQSWVDRNGGSVTDRQRKSIRRGVDEQIKDAQSRIASEDQGGRVGETFSAMLKRNQERGAALANTDYGSIEENMRNSRLSAQYLADVQSKPEREKELLARKSAESYAKYNARKQEDGMRVKVNGKPVDSVSSGEQSFLKASGPRSEFGFVDHASAMGSEVKQWQGGKTLDDVVSAIQETTEAVKQSEPEQT